MGFETMETYIWRSQNTVAQYIVTGSLLDLCGDMKSKKGAWMGMRWQKKACIDLAGERETAAAAADEDGLKE